MVSLKKALKMGLVQEKQLEGIFGTRSYHTGNIAS